MGKCSSVVSRKYVHIVAGFFPGSNRVSPSRRRVELLSIVAMNEAFDFGDQFFNAAGRSQRRMAFCVMMLNQISTWLSQDE